jgi:phage gp29-like protein
MTSDNGSSQSQANVHMQVRQEVVKSDAELLASSFNNTVAKWITAWNFPKASVPEIKFITDPPKDLQLEAQRMALICNATGYKPSIAYIQDVFGGEWINPQVANVDA